MLARRPWWSLIVVTVTLLFLASYGSAQLALSAPEQAKNAATATPAPTEEAEATSEPTEEAEATAEAAAATVPDCADLPAAAAATEAATAAAAAGSGGKVVKISYTQEPSSFNPHYTDQWFSWITTAFWLERPWNFDEKAQPCLVHLTEMPSVANGGISEDGLTMTFKLKDGLTWSDGEPYTADDWVFTWQMVMDEKNTVITRYPYDEFVEEVTAPDPLTVVVTLKEPLPAWQSVLFVKANGGAILPKHILEPVFEAEGTIDNAEWNRAPSVGIGPFVFKEFETGSHFSFTRNENYHGDIAKVDEVFFRILADDAAQNAALKAGDVDIGTFVSFADLPDLKENGLNIMSASSGYNEGLFLNLREDTAHPAMLDVNVRKALAMGIDREQITKDLLFGLTKPNVTFWDGSAWVNPELTPYPYDPEEAQKLLDEAGWVDSNGDGTRDKDGEELVLRYVTTPRPVRKDTQAVVQQQLKEIGIGVELFNFEGDVFFAGYAEEGPVAIGDSDFAQWSNVASFPDPNTDNWLCSQVPTEENPSGGNWFVCDEELDKLFQEQSVEIDPEKRLDLMYQIEQIMYDKVYYIGMWFDEDQWAVNPRLTGVKFSGVNPFFNANQWDIQE
ncbi:MAG: peptide ABC transporter substrate-binding protein [Anaerolineae bacterium]